MTQTAEKMKPKLAELTIHDRAELAPFLIGSLDEEADLEAETAWEAEVTRRVAEIKGGSTIGLPAEEVFKSIRKKR